MVINQDKGVSPPDIQRAFATVVLALYWLMSLCTHTLGIRLRTRGRLSLRLLGRSCAYELAIVGGLRSGPGVTYGLGDWHHGGTA